MLTALDATFLELEQADPSAHMHIGAVLVFAPPARGGPPALPEVRRRLALRLDALPRLRQRLSEATVGGRSFPCWEPDPASPGGATELGLGGRLLLAPPRSGPSAVGGRDPRGLEDGAVTGERLQCEQRLDPPDPSASDQHARPVIAHGSEGRRAPWALHRRLSVRSHRRSTHAATPEPSSPVRARPGSHRPGSRRDRPARQRRAGRAS
jgi:Wax ester synthase-like Acyl-CoA acyltransferase domain